MSEVLTDDDYAYWFWRLGRTRRQKIATLRDLLKHANGDEMTTDDRAVCLRALHDLGSSYVAEKVGATKTHHSSRRIFQSGVIDSDENDAHIVP